jgi:hypothetical protein
MPFTPYARIRNREAARMNRVVRGTLQELPFDVRMRILRRSRRRLTVQRLTDNALWIGLLLTLGAVVATELFAAVGRA